MSAKHLLFFTTNIILKAFNENDDRFVVLSTNTDYIAKIKQLQKFVLRNYSVGGIKAGIYYYTNPRESIKSAINKARKALQYTGDDLTQLYVCSINNFGHYLDIRREVKHQHPDQQCH